MSHALLHAFAVMENQIERATYMPSFCANSAFTHSIEEKHEREWACRRQGGTLLEATGTGLSWKLRDLLRDLVTFPVPHVDLPYEVNWPTRLYFHQQVCGGDEKLTIHMILHLFLHHACMIHQKVCDHFATLPLVWKTAGTKCITGATVSEILEQVRRQPLRRYRAFSLITLLPLAAALDDSHERKTSLDLVYDCLLGNQYADLSSDLTEDALSPTELLPPLCTLILSYHVPSTTVILSRLGDVLLDPTTGLLECIHSLELREAELKSIYESRRKRRVEADKRLSEEWDAKQKSERGRGIIRRRGKGKWGRGMNKGASRGGSGGGRGSHHQERSRGSLQGRARGRAGRRRGHAFNARGSHIAALAATSAIEGSLVAP
jgi:hypothetical protein